MKKQFSFALLTALLAVAIVPASAFATSQTATPSVDVTADTTFTITLGGDTTPNITGFTAEVANSTGAYAPSITNYIEVVDKVETVGNAGHKITWDFTGASFAYGGTEVEAGATYTNLAFTSGTTPGIGQIYFKISSGVNSATEVFTKTNSNCTGTGAISNYTHTSRVATTAETSQFVKSTNTCSGTARYVIPRLEVTGPSNGLGGGSYTSAATLTLYNGSN